MREPTPPKRSIGRRQTPTRAEFRRLALSAEIGTVTRGQLAVLAQNLPCTGIVNATEAYLLTTLINTAPAEAFDKGGRPIIFKSNQQLAFEINRSAGRVSRLLSRLFDAGLITMQDSGNYKRYPTRDVEGVIVDGCGIDLRILIVRYRELDELVRQARVEKAAANAALRRYRGTLRNLRRALASAYCLPQRIRARLEVRLEKVATLVGIATRAPSALLLRATALLEWFVERAMRLPRRPEVAFAPQDSACRCAESGMHRQSTSPDSHEESSDSQCTATAGPMTSARELTPEAGRRRAVKQPRRSRQEMVALQDILRAIPALSTYGLALPRSWADLARIAPQMCRIAGISDDARRRAVDQMGEHRAAVAIAITLQKLDRQEVSSPDGYLRAMTERAGSGELHLSRSIFGLAARYTMEPLP
ncbi:plasmid replication protein RepC [Sinorhizobium fredii]|uniref:Replication protein C domain-containing protein n=1 Tax=Rhizobium fredii TaxID=380 RepID=A0A2L0HC90_RHIFR|nr:plasmid replication protein RepC [Sinorhizobium fredii]AUX79118.1 replication protein C domain-containing protein [Sinorhizobium fredii]